VDEKIFWINMDDNDTSIYSEPVLTNQEGVLDNDYMACIAIDDLKRLLFNSNIPIIYTQKFIDKYLTHIPEGQNKEVK